jgi:hypothetical protein
MLQTVIFLYTKNGFTYARFFYIENNPLFSKLIATDIDY